MRILPGKGLRCRAILGKIAINTRCSIRDFFRLPHVHECSKSNFFFNNINRSVFYFHIGLGKILSDNSDAE